ncbi:MAG: hypothetical protein JST06_10215 [Bacteroidetes bacterium]|nr:hypothetical protein [Bacteroidota bacterium]MBS1630157.1 hypothetical protein [Bacteroidota bacterium]
MICILFLDAFTIFSSLFNPKIMGKTQLAYEAAYAGSSRNLRVPTHTHTQRLGDYVWQSFVL